MDLSNFDTITGIATVIMLLLGYIMGIKTLFIYRGNQNQIVLITSFLFFSLPSPWLEFGVRFLFVVFGKTISNTVGVFLFAWSIPILVIFWCYITSSLFTSQPWIKQVSIVITSIPGIIFLISIYIFRDYSIDKIPNSIGVNYVYAPYQNCIILFYGLLGILFVFPTYSYFSFKSDNKLLKFKTGMIALSVLIFSIAGVMDGLISFKSIAGVLIFRIMLMFSLILLYLGYNTPNFIKVKYE